MTTGKTTALTVQTFVYKVMCLIVNTLSRFVMAFFPRSMCLLISGLQPYSTVIVESKKRKSVPTCSLPYLPWSDWAGCHDLSFLNVEFQISFFTLLFHPHQEAFLFLLIFCHCNGIICISEVVDISPGNLDSCDSSSSAFLMTYSVYKLNKQGDNVQPCLTTFPILNKSVFPCKALTVVSWSTYRFFMKQIRWSATPIPPRIFHSLLWSTQPKPLG